MAVRTLLLALILTPVTARAENRALARRHFQQGKRLFLARQYGPAILAFKEAYRHRPHRVIQINIALAYARVGRDVAAITHLRRYLDRATPGDPPLPPELVAARRRVGVLILSTSRPTSGILVDDVFAGRGRADVVVKPGPHRIAIRHGARVIARRTIQVGPGSEVRWSHGAPRQGPVPARRLRLHWRYLVSAAALTAAALTSAIALTVTASRLGDRLADDPTDRELLSGVRAHERSAGALWGVFAAGAAATALLAAFTRFGRAPADRPALGPGPGAVGLSVTWPTE